MPIPKDGAPSVSSGCRWCLGRYIRPARRWEAQICERCKNEESVFWVAVKELNLNDHNSDICDISYGNFNSIP